MRIPSAILLVAILAGCGLVPGADPDLERMRQQAHEELDRWAAAVADAGGQQDFSLTGDSTSQIGDWEDFLGSNYKIALLAGRIEAATELPGDAPPPGEVRWDDGRTEQVPLMSATDALNEIRSGADSCDGCDVSPLKVTGATLATVKVSTTRGMAAVPAWAFAIEGTAVQVTHVAVASRRSVRVSRPEPDPSDPPLGLSITYAFGSFDRRQLTVGFVGGCDSDYEAEGVESSLAIVVIVKELPNPSGGGCRLIGHDETATLQLAEPLGDRAVLEGRLGLPVPVTR